MIRPVTGKIDRRATKMDSVTIRDFDGGWNVIDSELVLTSKYAVRLRNMNRAPDGTLKVRFGTRKFSDIAEQLDADIVNMEYFANFIAAVGENGNIAAIDGQGTAAPVWNHDIAGLLPGAPSGWSDTDFVSFAQFKSELYLGNGIDKPLLINRTYHVDYVQDLGTLSNLNTPIGRYCTSFSQYMIWGGIAGRESIISISAKNAGGTYVGDPAPNDAVEVDLASYISDGSTIMKGLSHFRDKLVVQFEKCLILVVLGEYNEDGDHVPRVDDVISGYGSVSHRAVQDLGNDMLFSDIVGVPSIKRALFTETIQPDRPSQLIDPQIQRDYADLSEGSLEDRVFSIYNRLEGQYQLFVPNSDFMVDTIETRAFVYTLIDALKVKAWAEWTEMNWRSSCLSQLGRVFYSRGTEIYLLGNDNDPIYSDRQGAEECFSDNTCFNDQTGFGFVDLGVDGVMSADTGVPIIFDWELPWADFNKRMKEKAVKYIGFDVQGDGRYTVEGYVDNLYRLRGDLGEEFTDDTFYTDDFGHNRYRNEPVRTPEVDMEFVGGDALGYGADYGLFYGGGRSSEDALLWEFPMKGKIHKLRIAGETLRPLRFVSISMLYKMGGYRR